MGIWHQSGKWKYSFIHPGKWFQGFRSRRDAHKTKRKSAFSSTSREIHRNSSRYFKINPIVILYQTLKQEAYWSNQIYSKKIECGK